MKRFCSLLLLLLATQFLSAQFNWRHKACLPAPTRSAVAAFSVNNMGYIIGGYNSSFNATNQVWQYDPSTNVWSAKNNFPLTVSGVNVFVINNVAYAGLGLDGSGNYHTEFYKYDDVADTWSPVASFPGAPRYLAMTFTFNGKGYLGCGKGTSLFNDFYEYDPAGDMWTQKANFPGSARQTGFGGATNNFGYFGLGSDGGASSQVFRYDAISDKWKQMNDFIGNSRWAPGYFLLGDTIYVAAGRNDNTFFDDCWRYDEANDIWVQQQSFTCIAQARATTYGFALNGEGYIMCGDYGTSFAHDLLEFGPDDLSFLTYNKVLPNDTAICSGSVNMTLSTGNSCTRWSTGETGSQITITQPGQYWAIWPDSCGMFGDSVTVALGTGNNNLGNDTTYCGPFFRILETGVYNTVWSTGAVGPYIGVYGTGTFWFTVSNNCGTATDTINIIDKTAPVVNLGRDTFLCFGDTIALNATNPNASYRWNDNSTKSVHLVTRAGNYAVTVTDTSGCAVMDDINIAYAVQAPIVDLGKDIEICGTSATLHAGIPNAKYLWSDNSTDSLLTVYVSGNYTITVTDGCGTGTSEINVSIHPDDCALLVPTAFSPNGDGNNDLFRGITHCTVSKYSLSVFNRWGELVYQTDNITRGWDGRFHNMDSPMGVYVYTIEYFNYCENKLKRISGNVTLVR